MSFIGGGDNPSIHNGAGAPVGYAGDPGGGNKTCTNCHAGTASTLAGIFSSNIPGTGYVPGNTYTITANFVKSGHVEYGFQASPQDISGAAMGSMANLGTQTQLIGQGGKYVTHTNSGKSGTGSITWNFEWTAPTSGSGAVTFYGAFNATNNNNSTSGDQVFKSTMSVNVGTASVFNSYENHFSLSTFPNPATDNLAINFYLENQSDITIDLIDLKGNKIQMLLLESNSRGETTKSIDISSYQKGIYFIRLTVDGKQSVKKFIKL